MSLIGLYRGCRLKDLRPSKTQLKEPLDGLVMGRSAARTLCNFSLRTASEPEGSSAK